MYLLWYGNHLPCQSILYSLLRILPVALQPSYVGPYRYQANLSIPVNSSAGSNQGSTPLTPLFEPPPFQVPPDIFQPRNDLHSNNSTCLVGQLLSLPFYFQPSTIWHGWHVE